MEKANAILQTVEQRLQRMAQIYAQLNNIQQELLRLASG